MYNFNKIITAFSAFRSVLSDNEPPTYCKDVNEWKVDEVYADVDIFFNKHKAWRDKTLTIDSLAAKLGTNRTYVSVAIHRTKHMSVPAYVNTLRIKDAKELINDNPSRTLKDISSDVGFTTYSTFCTAFKSIEGTSPSDYKQNVLAEKLRRLNINYSFNHTKQ